MPRDGEEIKKPETPWFVVDEMENFRPQDFRISASALRDAGLITGIDKMVPPPIDFTMKPGVIVGVDLARNSSEGVGLWFRDDRSIHMTRWTEPSREAVNNLKRSGRISQAYGRKVLANALIRALQQRPEDFSSRAGHRGYLDDEESGQTWDLEYPLHIQMSESSACVCHELDLGPWHSLRVWFAVARWRKRHGDYRAHMEEALRLQAMEKDPC